MLFDLASAPPEKPIEVDVCIIGSGPAGLALARALVQRDLSVAILDAGPATPEIREHLADLVFDRREYRGATLGRAHGFGGTSSLWGGQLLPIRPHEMIARPYIGAPAWPMDHGEIAEHFPQLDSWLNVTSGPFDLVSGAAAGQPIAALDWQGFDPRSSKWIPFRGRNLARAWWPAIAATGKAKAWLNSTVAAWDTVGPRSARRVERVVARAHNGNLLEVRPRFVAICAGTLESTRLALELCDPSHESAVLGRYLHDHLSVRIAQLEITDRAGFAQLFSPRFDGSTMRSPRLELSSEAARVAGLPAMYAHFVAEAPEDSGFALVRDTLRSLQRRQSAAAFRCMTKLPWAVPGIAEIVYWRIVKKRLVFPADASIYIHVDFEQPPDADNRVHVGKPTRPGERGRLHVDWDLACEPSRVVTVMTEHIRRLWQTNRLDRFATPRFVDAATVAGAWPTNLYDIYHPAGTTRMGTSAQNGAVDSRLLLYGTDNAYVLSSSVFPSMGSANPTYTLMAMALRLASFLAKAGH